MLESYLAALQGMGQLIFDFNMSIIARSHKSVMDVLALCSCNYWQWWLMIINCITIATCNLMSSTVSITKLWLSVTPTVSITSLWLLVMPMVSITYLVAFTATGFLVAISLALNFCICSEGQASLTCTCVRRFSLLYMHRTEES